MINNPTLTFYLNKDKAKVMRMSGLYNRGTGKETIAGTTWFWNKRTGGKLSFIKVGGTIFYSKADILMLFVKSKTVQNDTTSNE